MTVADQLAAWRSIHKIDPIEAEHPTFGRITRCSVDGIRVHWITRAWRHDRDEILAMLDQEFGGAWGFPKKAMDARDELDEGTATFESVR